MHMYSRYISIYIYICDDAVRTSLRAGRRAGPPRVPLKQAGTVAEEANEKVHIASIKWPRSAESSRISSPAISYIWVSCECVPGILYDIYSPGRFLWPMVE